MKRLTCVALLLAVMLCMASCSDHIEYTEISHSTFRYCPIPKETEKAEDFVCKVVGETIDLYKAGDDAFGIVRMNKPVNVSIDCSFVVEHAEVYPKTYCDKASINNSVIKFGVDHPGSYIVNLDDKRRVFLFFNDDEDVSAGETDVYFKQGVNNAPVSVNDGVLQMESNTTYVLQYGAVLDAKIIGTNVSNVCIIGGGVINASVELSGCTDVKIDGVVCKGAVSVQFCRNVSIKNTKMISDGDALTLSTCSDIDVAGSFIKSRGHSVSVKNIPDTDGKLNRSVSENICVRDCVIDTVDGDSLLIGPETVGKTIQMVSFKNIIVAENTGGVCMAVYNANNSHIYRTAFEDVTIENAQPADDRNYLIDVRNMYSFDYSDKYGQTEIGSIEKMNFYNIHMNDGRKDIGINFIGFKEGREGLLPITHKISDVSFKDCSICDFKLVKSYYYMYLGEYTEGFNFE